MNEIPNLKETIEYLRGLRELRDDWISPDSVRPDNHSIECAIHILGCIGGGFSGKLILGPIPSGGIHIEIQRDADNALYISIPNNQEQVTIAFQRNGYFF